MRNNTNQGKWSELELEILDLNYPVGGSLLCKEKGLNRSNYAIFNKAFKRGLKYSGYWTTKDLELLKKNYPIGGSEYVNLKGVDKSIEDIDREARDLGLRRNTKNDLGTNGWCVDDIDILVKYYIKGGYPLCREKGLKKNKISAMAKADQLKLRVFSDFELEVVSDLELSLGDKVELIGDGRTITEIKNVVKYIQDVKVSD